ncbi:MAG: hypothetical protein HPPSJP_2180 [Candidatus Hepatoplasma scabrum]|nr:MAG: hypothetical protein HPPSJP_2180 [Candidatus Hepatoplasma sp.]
MKKIFSLLLIPFLFLSIGLNKPNHLKNKELSTNDKILSLKTWWNNSGATVDTDNDLYADTLYMWGDNQYGQIGDNSTSDKHVPTKITLQGQSDWGGNVIDLSLGSYHSGVTIDTDLDGYADTLYMWGRNNYGQLGDNSTSDKHVPTKITPQGQSDWGGDIIDLDLGTNNSGATVDTDLDGYADTLYMWGYNGSGQLGDDSTINKDVPTKITPQGQSDWSGNIIDLSLSGSHSGVTIDTNLDGYADTLYMWGDNNEGQIGDNTVFNRDTPTKITPQGQSDWNGDIIDLSLSGNHSGITIDEDLDGYADTLYMWGDNSDGKLGDDSTINKDVPTKITPQGQSNWGGDIIDLDLGSNDSGVTIDEDLDGYADTLYVWGDNSEGQIGDNNTSDKHVPTKITPQESDWDGNVIDLSLGSLHSGITIDIDLDGYADTLYMWGHNADGQLGDNSTVDKHVPTLIDSSFDFFINKTEFYYEDNNNIELNIILNDYKDIINQSPEVILIDQNDVSYTTTFITDKSNINNDQYYYQVNNIMYGQSYNFTKIIINEDEFELNQPQITTDYLISSYNFVSAAEETATFALNLDQNSADFNINNYTDDQRKIELNYTNIDNNVSNSQQFILNADYQVELQNLNAETNYKIDSINYFYQNGTYKYTQKYLMNHLLQYL